MYLEVLCSSTIHLSPEGLVGVGHLLSCLEKDRYRDSTREYMVQNFLGKTLLHYSNLLNKNDDNKIEEAVRANMVCLEKMRDLLNVITDEKHLTVLKALIAALESKLLFVTKNCQDRAIQQRLKKICVGVKEPVNIAARVNDYLLDVENKGTIPKASIAKIKQQLEVLK